MNIRNWVLHFLGMLSLLLIFSPFAYPDFSESNVGTKGAQFLKIPVGAKAIGMGEAQSAIANDANAIFYNAAGLTKLQQRSGEYMFARYLDETSYHWIAVGIPVKSRITSMGLAIQYFSVGNIDETTVQGSKVSNFNPSDLAVNFSLAHQILNIPLGVNFKFIQTKIKETATALALDLGTQYSLDNGKFLLGLSLQNLGSTYRFENEKTKLPILIRLGSGYKIKNHWVVAADLIFPEDNSPQCALGTDYEYKILNDLSLSGRIGYHSRSRKIEGLSGVTSGFGIKFASIHLDYAWTPLGNLGDVHRISLGVNY